MTNTIKLVVGDWSGDGHMQTHEEVIKSNLTGDEIESAYKLGVKKIGFDLRKKVAVSYEDSSITQKQYNKLKSGGFFTAMDYMEESFEEGKDMINCDEYMDVFLWFVKTGNPEFKYEIACSEPSIHIGGYGLFR